MAHTWLFLGKHHPVHSETEHRESYFYHKESAVERVIFSHPARMAHFPETPDTALTECTCKILTKYRQRYSV